MSDLDISLDSIAPRQGRRSRNDASKKRNLTPGDIHALGSVKAGALEQDPSFILKIRATHHALARLVAAGRRNEEISQIMGYSPSYVSSIQSDPAFKELVSYYQSLAESEFQLAEVTLHERLTAVSQVAAEELLERVTLQPESFTNNELNDLVKTTADRTGFGPQARITNLNVNVDLASRLERARSRAQLGPETQGPLPGVLDLRPLTQGGSDVETQKELSRVIQSEDLT